MDCSFNIIGNLDEFLLRILTPKHSMYFLEHPSRNKISQEFKRVEILKKDTINNIERVKGRYNQLRSKKFFSSIIFLNFYFIFIANIHI